MNREKQEFLMKEFFRVLERSKRKKGRKKKKRFLFIHIIDEQTKLNTLRFLNFIFISKIEMILIEVERKCLNLFFFF